MKKERNTPNQVTLALRILCGGYLLYTAWDLRGAFGENPLYIVAAVVFAVVGLVLGGVSVYQLIQAQRAMMSPAKSEAAENSEECEERLCDE